MFGGHGWTIRLKLPSKCTYVCFLIHAKGPQARRRAANFPCGSGSSLIINDREQRDTSNNLQNKCVVYPQKGLVSHDESLKTKLAS